MPQYGSCDGPSRKAGGVSREGLVRTGTEDVQGLGRRLARGWWGGWWGGMVQWNCLKILREIPDRMTKVARKKEGRHHGRPPLVLYHISSPDINILGSAKVPQD